MGTGIVSITFARASGGSRNVNLFLMFTAVTDSFVELSNNMWGQVHTNNKKPKLKEYGINIYLDYIRPQGKLRQQNVNFQQ